MNRYEFIEVKDEKLVSQKSLEFIDDAALISYLNYKKILSNSVVNCSFLDADMVALYERFYCFKLGEGHFNFVCKTLRDDFRQLVIGRTVLVEKILSEKDKYYAKHTIGVVNAPKRWKK